MRIHGWPSTACHRDGDTLTTHLLDGGLPGTPEPGDQLLVVEDQDGVHPAAARIGLWSIESIEPANLPDYDERLRRVVCCRVPC